MTKKKSSIVLLVMALLTLIGGVIANYFFDYDRSSNDSFLKQNCYVLLLGIILSALVLAGLWIYNKFLRLLGYPKENAKPFVLLGVALYIVSVIIFGFLNGNDNQRFVITTGEIGFILFGFTISSLIISMFLIDVDDRKKIIDFDDYDLYYREWNCPNEDNQPVTIKNKHNKLLAPEVYFENDEYRKLYESHFDYIWKTAEQEAKKTIFENGFETETSGEWYMSRIDFLEGDGFAYPQLVVYMTFISKTIKSYSLYGIVEIGRKVIESDYCRIGCVFEYRKVDTEKPFTYKETEAELISHF